ncbi:MAG: hypothetical protein ACR2Q3_02065 [Woeseiaceae bacterium]
MNTLATTTLKRGVALTHGEPEIPPGNPVEVPPEKAPVDIPPGGPIETPVPQPENPPATPIEVPTPKGTALYERTRVQESACID